MLKKTVKKAVYKLSRSFPDNKRVKTQGKINNSATKKLKGHENLKDFANFA